MVITSQVLLIHDMNVNRNIFMILRPCEGGLRVFNSTSAYGCRPEATDGGQRWQIVMLVERKDADGVGLSQDDVGALRTAAVSLKSLVSPSFKLLENYFVLLATADHS